MIDTLVANLDKALTKKNHELFGLTTNKFIFLTIHRPSNVNKETLELVINNLKDLSRELPVIFPVHPRTKKCLNVFKIKVNDFPDIHFVDPLGYHDCICFAKNARLVITDSGGLQEETT